jgi:hypothetical protein
VIYVEKEEVRPPVIEGIDKVFGLRGETIETFVRGRNLRDATDIRFERVEARSARTTRSAAARKSPRTSNTQIDARILAGGTETELRVAIRIPGNAAFGEYKFSVTTRAGTAESPVDFLVTAVPQIDGFGPSRSHLGETEEVTIEGSHLLVPSLEPDFEDREKPLRFHSVEIVSTEGAEPGPVPGITTEIVKARSKPESICANINVGQDVSPGEYRLRVITPAGWIDAEETFLVQAGRQLVGDANRLA